MCDLDWEDLDFANRKSRVRDAKTQAGIRQVDMTPRLVEELLAYRSSLDDVDGKAPVFPNRKGRRRTRNNIETAVLPKAVARATELRADRREPPLPHVTPHTLRHTYIRLMLEAGASVPYVQSQVGHRDASTTLNVYADVLKRREHSHFSEAFDKLMRDAVPSSANNGAAGQTRSPSGSDEHSWTV